MKSITITGDDNRINEFLKFIQVYCRQKKLKISNYKEEISETDKKQSKNQDKKRQKSKD